MGIAQHWTARITMGKKAILDRSFVDLFHDDVELIGAVAQRRRRHFYVGDGRNREWRLVGSARLAN